MRGIKASFQSLICRTWMKNFIHQPLQGQMNLKVTVAPMKKMMTRTQHWWKPTRSDSWDCSKLTAVRSIPGRGKTWQRLWQPLSQLQVPSNYDRARLRKWTGQSRPQLIFRKQSLPSLARWTSARYHKERWAHSVWQGKQEAHHH